MRGQIIWGSGAAGHVQEWRRAGRNTDPAPVETIAPHPSAIDLHGGKPYAGAGILPRHHVSRRASRGARSVGAGGAQGEEGHDDRGERHDHHLAAHDREHDRLLLGARQPRELLRASSSSRAASTGRPRRAALLGDEPDRDRQQRVQPVEAARGPPPPGTRRRRAPRRPPRGPARHARRSRSRGSAAPDTSARGRRARPGRCPQRAPARPTPPRHASSTARAAAPNSRGLPLSNSSHKATRVVI